MNPKYAIGVDFGTESCRALLVNVQTGEELAVSVHAYPNGVISEELPCGRKLEADWALQNPADYVEVLYGSVSEVLRQARVEPQDVVGVGIDFTSCTILPVDEDLEPLCFDSKWRDDPHSWVKLWKHHAAQSEADEITKLAERRNEQFLHRHGGKISSEWMFPKILQILNESPDIFEATDLFIEAGDWLVSRLTGNLVRSSATSGYKALWHKESGYPSPDFFQELHPALEHIIDTKMRGSILPVGTRAGELMVESARLMGLLPGTPVAVTVIDAHASVPAVGAVRSGQLVMAMGTSTCHMLLADEEQPVEGVCGIVEDGMIPRLFGYEAGQAAVGDIFAWYVKNGVPDYVKRAAEGNGMGVHQWLEKNASAYKPGEIGLLALDWWNGNRSVLVDAELSGLIIGLTLNTKPEEIYRSLLEATAFGTRRIIDSFLEAGLEVNEIFACGGLPQRNQLLMQIYADVTNREIKIAASPQDPALGAALFGSLAAGKERGGHDSIFEAVHHMAKVREETFKPIPENVAVYEKLYREYLTLHDYFGRENMVMKRLKSPYVSACCNNQQ